MDVEKTMQFLLEQQAKFDARLESHALQFDNEMTRINNTLVAVTTFQENANAILVTLAQKHLDLAESHRMSVESHERGMAELRKHGEETDRRIRELEKHGEDTDRRIGAVATLIESHIRNHN